MKRNRFIPLLFFYLLIATSSSIAQNPVSWKFSLEDAGNGEVNLIARATIQQGWHLYDTNIPDGGPTPTSISFDHIAGAQPIGKFHAEDATPHVAYDEVFQMKIGTFDGTVRFVQKLKITDKAAFAVTGDVRAQACDDKTCTPPLPVEFSFKSSDLPSGLVVTESEDNISEITSINETASPAADSVSSISSTNVSVDKDLLWQPVIEELKTFGSENDNSSASLWSIFIKGLIWGFAALLTPCVWPMIPITVSFFLNRNKRSRRKATQDAIVYGISIIIIYLALGLIITSIFGASALNNIATSAVFNLIFFALLIVFAASFLGAFELVLPASWTNKMDSKVDSTTGMISIFFMAFTLALVSFSCTGPIIGWLLVDAATQGNYLSPTIGMFGFALALSIPFALFAVFPTWLKNLPKSGSWLNSVKVVLGFIVLALSFKFLSVADLSNGWGLLNRDIFLSIWIVIAVFLGMYLLGKIKLAHDDELQHVSLTRIFLSMASFAFAIYMIPGLWGAPLKPISAILPPMETQDFKLNDASITQKFTDYETGMAYAAQTGKPVLLDFAGHGCVNCHKMDAAVLTDPHVKEIIDNQYVLITLMVDEKDKLPSTLEVDENGRKTKLKTVGDKWSYLQRHKFGTQSQPYYVILNHEGKPLSPGYGFNDNVTDFIEFLENGLKNFND